MPADRPNIIVILSDQLRRDALGAYGDRNVRTPHIDALAEGGTRFANACSTYPICVPFRFSLMTGQYAHSRLVPGIEWRMSPAERTLADEFNDAGYETVYLGKWHLYGDPWHVTDDADLPDPGLKINLTRVPRAKMGFATKRSTATGTAYLELLEATRCNSFAGAMHLDQPFGQLIATADRSKVRRPRLNPSSGDASSATAAASLIQSSTTMSAGLPTAIP